MRKFVFLCFLLLQKIVLLAQPHTYRFNLELNDTAQALSGSVNISFRNNSGRDIRSIYLHLPPRSLEWKGSLLHRQFLEFQNVDLHYAKKNERGYISVPSLKINEQEFTACIKCEFDSILLNKPLRSGDSLNINLDFNIKLPDAAFTGTGYDGTVYRIVDWLPRIATLDTNRWHLNPVTYQNDIYQNLDAFHISLTLDNDLVVASNARLETPSEKQQYRLMKENPLQRLPSSGGKKTLEFYHKGASSLQFFISRDFYLFPAHDSVDLFLTEADPYLAYMLPEADKMVNDFFRRQIGNEFTKHYSLVLLRDKTGEYQSDKLLSLNLPSSGFEFASELAHARAQQFFRYEMAVNGIKDVWLARGLPYFYKYEFIETSFPEKKWLPLSHTVIGWIFELDEFDYGYQNQLLYLYLARQGLDQPMNTTADSLTRLNYEATAQAKSYLALNHLKGYAGERDFNRALRRFYLQNKGERAGPEELKQSLQYYIFKDIDWFFEKLIPAPGYNDYQLVKAENCPTVSTATVRSKGSVTIPYSLTGFKNDTAVTTQWYEGHEGKKSVPLYHADYDKVILNYHRTVPEFSQKNNTVRTRGILKQSEPLRLQFWKSFENPEKSQIYWMPSANYNAYDKLLLGLSFYNDGSLIDKPFEYLVAPEYSFGTGQLTGYLSGLFNIIPRNGPFYRISAGLFTRYYHYDEGLAYFRVSPSVNLYFRRKYRESSLLQKLRFRGVRLQREVAPLYEGLRNDISNASYTIFDATYRLQDIDILHPYTLELDFQYGDQFSRFTAEADLRWMLPNKRWLIWRNFGGVFLNNEYSRQGVNGNYYSLGLSGTQDYLFDYTYIGRSDQSGIWSQQFFTTDGGFKSETNIFSDNYMLTTNLSVPVWTAFGVFGDAGIVDQTEKIYWDYGIRVAVFTDFLEIYFPFQNQDVNFLKQPAYYNHIRYVLNLDLNEIIERLRRGYY